MKLYLRLKSGINILRKKQILIISEELFFKSYGQALDHNIIFTLDPESGKSYAADRKLAEHLDFVPYLGKERNLLLRGEFKGDVNNDSQPVVLGLWSVESEEDLEAKLRLLRQGANILINMGCIRIRSCHSIRQRTLSINMMLISTGLLH